MGIRGKKQRVLIHDLYIDLTSHNISFTTLDIVFKVVL